MNTGYKSRRPFEVDVDFLHENVQEMVEATISDLTSEFLLLPKGTGFLEYTDFRSAYEILKRHTAAFESFTEAHVWQSLREDSRAFCVIRSMLGLTPPEWAELANSELGSDVSQGAARTFDQACRRDPSYIRMKDDSALAMKTSRRLKELVSVAIQNLSRGAPPKEEGVVHRLAQFDTRDGVESIRHAASEHVPYAVLLYERYLGRPIATHRDAVSELVGEVMENAVEEQLRSAGIS